MRKLIFLPVLFLIACAGTPKREISQKWYKSEAPYDSANLKMKAIHYGGYTLDLVNDAGLLLYSSFKPWGNVGNKLDNYLESHNIADAPAWHGIFMASLALKSAVTGVSSDKELARLAKGLIKYYKVTGIPGLLGRSYIDEQLYRGPRLPWMATPESSPDKYWTNKPNGYWWRNGVAKNHLNLAVFGCAIPLYLDRTEKIILSPQTRHLLISVMVPAVRHLINGGYKIRDFDGKFTKFGDIRPNVAFGPDWPQIPGLPNGFNQMLLLHMLCSAAPYDETIKNLYEEKAEEWADGIGKSMELVGEAIAKIGHQKLGKPSFSDMSAFGLAFLSLSLQENRRTILKGARRGMTGLWEFMRYQRNPTFTFPYWMVRGGPGLSGYVEECKQDLRDFPTPDLKTAWVNTKKDTDKVQPLSNRPINSHYWKSSPFRLQTSQNGRFRHPVTGAMNYYSGQDYLLAYYLGRFMNLIAKDE